MGDKRSGKGKGIQGKEWAVDGRRVKSVKKIDAKGNAFPRSTSSAFSSISLSLYLFSFLSRSSHRRQERKRSFVRRHMPRIQSRTSTRPHACSTSIIHCDALSLSLSLALSLSLSLALSRPRYRIFELAICKLQPLCHRVINISGHARSEISR